VVRGNRRRQALKVAQDLRPGSKIAARDFADHERVHQDIAVHKRFSKRRVTLAEMIYPDGRVN
jgi:hypothetical protein